MSIELKRVISDSKISVLRSYVYGLYIVYELILNKSEAIYTCNYCDLNIISCNSVTYSDKNNITKCGHGLLSAYDSELQVRYIYKKMSMSNISLFLSRYILDVLARYYPFHKPSKP